MFSHLLTVIFLFAVHTSLAREAPMSLDNLVFGHACATLEGIDILGEAGVKKSLLCQENEKGM